jgi:uncharacterized membrane protein YphA (DoxX/SURF4 family)/peroxiredoxin
VETVVLALRLLLAGVFLVAGVAKLRDRDGSRQALEDFGVPDSLARPAGLLLPVAEIAIAAALIVPPSARWGALAAAALLAVFVLAIANALAHGRAPDCHCFGQIHSEPAGWSTLARNGLLIALAAVVAAFGPGPALDGWIDERSGPELAAAGATLAVAAIAAVLVRRWNRRRKRRLAIARAMAQAEAAKRPPGKPVGSPAPPFALRGLRGEQHTLEELTARGSPVVLVFVHPGCAPCRQLLALLGEWQATLADRLTIAVLTQGSARANRPLCEEHGIANFLLQKYAEVYDAYEARGTPSAVVVDADGRIASATVMGDIAIEELIRLTLRGSESWEQPSLVV